MAAGRRQVVRRPGNPGRHNVAMFFNIFGGANLGEGPRINYDTLAGMPASFGKEASEYAMQKQIPATSKDGYSIATFAGGCFWGLELAYQRVPGVIATSVGYTQGSLDQPTYKEVCTASTGHTEAVQLIYDPKVVSYTDLCELLFTRIDPTALNRVGNDFGPQYRHGIYAHTDQQLEQAQSFVESKKSNFRKPIVTEVKSAEVYWPAEEYHQQYLEKGGRFNAPQSASKGCTDTIRCYG